MQIGERIGIIQPGERRQDAFEQAGKPFGRLGETSELVAPVNAARLVALEQQRARSGPRLFGWQEQQGQAIDTLIKRSEEHTSELQSLMRISYAVFCLKKKKFQLYPIPTYSTTHTLNNDIYSSLYSHHYITSQL